MSTRTDALADPLVSSVALLLTVPLLELYAVLWRVGVVEVRGTDHGRRRRKAHRSQVVEGLPGPICPDPSAHGSEWPLRRSQQSRLLSPAPSRVGPGGCSRATG
ncbi:Rv1535 domain-containing protein [Mycobacterium decipiens]|uniref:Rv1535 domain-containing protein n=1 Tax=Mycobacterium decipiens TaxID=1430326 RepID=UPI003101579F